MPWPRRGDGSRTSVLAARIPSQKLPSVNPWGNGTSGSSPLSRSCRRELLLRLSRVRRRQTLPLAVLPGRCSTLGPHKSKASGYMWPNAFCEPVSVVCCSTLGPHKSKASGYMWPNAFCEPVSVVCRTGLRHVETEIEKSRAETGAANGPNLRAEFRELPARDSTYQANPREYRRFLLTRKSKRRDKIGRASCRERV